jgi:hypothetical protein
MAAKTHRDKPDLSESFALAEGGGAAWFTILVDSSPDSSEGINSMTIKAGDGTVKSIVIQNVQYSSTIRPVGRD